MAKVGTSPILQRAIAAIAAGNIINNLGGQFQNVKVYRHQLYHRVDVAATSSRLEFFNVQPSLHVCNMPAGANGLPNDYGFVCTGVHANFEQGYNVAGTAVAAVEPYNTSTAPLTTAVDIKQMLDRGIFRLDFADERVVDVFGLCNLAGGNRPQLSAVSNSATTAAAAFATNGHGHDDNGWAMSPWRVLWPGEAARASVEWNFTRTLVGAYVLNITLDGIVVRM